MNAAYPPSFGENPLLYAWALGSVTALGFMMAMIAGWMARDIWRDRFYVHPRDPLTLFRAILLFAATTGLMRTLPEAAYMYAWNEVEPKTMDLILTIKRLTDGLAIAPGAVWPIMLTLAYPAIAHSLRMSQRYASTDMWAPWPRLVRPAAALLLIFAIALLVAISKLYLGVAGR